MPIFFLIFFFFSKIVYFFAEILYNNIAIAIGNFEPGQSGNTAALRNQLCAVVLFFSKEQNCGIMNNRGKYMHTDRYFMNKAYQEAIKAANKDEVPVGAVLVKDNKIIARAHNLKEKKQCAVFHAEIECIQKACKKLNTWHLDDCVLYVTLEPCTMCAGAIIQSRIKKVVYGALDYKGGAMQSTYHLYDIKGFNHYPETVYYDKNEQCSKILTSYFKNKRKNV